MAETKLASTGGLEIPVFYVHANGKLEPAAEPIILRHTILESVFAPDDLKSLAVVKLVQSPQERLSIDELGELLRHKPFPDGPTRGIAFSSGDNYYFTSKTLKAKIHDFVQTEPDAACRYGSLLASDCFRGTATLDDLRLKLVNYQNPQDLEFRTGDCHGKISPQLAECLGAEANSPFQFRLAWCHDWAADPTVAPEISFLAKGTLLVDPELTTDRGYDLVLDRSSIKGVKKSHLDEFIPCGEYDLSKVVMGNRSNAKVAEYNNSWQFTIWFSEAAVLQDLGTPTRIAAQKLAQVQREPVRLARYIVNQYDKQQDYLAEQQRQTAEGELAQAGDLETDQTVQRQDSRMIALLRADRYGQLLEAPKVAEFMRDYVARSWRDLAVKTGLKHSSAMAMPAPELERGVVCIPHLPEGDVVVTRYPIVSRDNIRLYHNTHSPELFNQSGKLGFNSDASRLMKVQNVVWINPQDAEEYHQADFDGDALVVTPAQKLPNIAQEIRRAGEPAEFEKVKQRPKKAYMDYVDQDGKPLYTLPKIAAASSQNKVGAIANAIGAVQSSMPGTQDDQEPFDYDQRKLLNRLFAALQIEVDYQKSAERHEDVQEIGGKTLLKDVRKWREQYPCHFFDYCKSPETYRHYPLPADQAGTGSVNAVPREIVNPIWEAVQIRERSRDEFRYLFPKPNVAPDRWQKYLNWADELKVRFQASVQDINQELGQNSASGEFVKRLGQVYDTYREEIAAKFKTPQQRLLAASALWHSQHTRPDRNKHEKQCQAIAQKLPVTFGLDPCYTLPNEAVPREAYVLSIPFGSGKLERDRVLRTKEKLDELGVRYDAVIHPKWPVVDFVLQPIEQQPNPKLVQNLIEQQETKHGANLVDPKRIPDDLWIVAPPSYSWALSHQRSGSGALVYNLFTEEICQQLQQFQVEKIAVLGIQHNDFKQESFTDKSWQKPVKVKVDKLKFEKTDPNYYRYHGTPALAIDGKILGTFAQDSPKLPIGTTFEATIERQANKCLLHLESNSVKLPFASTEIGSSHSSSSSNSSNHTKLDDLPMTNSTAQSSSQFSDEQRRQVTGMLMASVAALYATQATEGQSTTLELDPRLKWKAFIKPDGETFIRAKSGADGVARTIAHFNIQSQGVYRPLAEEHVQSLVAGAISHQATQQASHQIAPKLNETTSSPRNTLKKQVEQD